MRWGWWLAQHRPRERRGPLKIHFFWADEEALCGFAPKSRTMLPIVDLRDEKGCKSCVDMLQRIKEGT